MKIRVGAAVAMASLLGGCAVGPDYRPPATAALDVPSRYVLAAPAAQAEDLSSWWTRFDDPLLTDLIAQATARNLDIKVSEARLREAREALVQSRASLFPTLSGSAGVTRNDTERHRAATLTTNGTQLSLGLDASWQADLFGGNRRSVEASRASLDAASFDLAAVRMATAGEVATNYVAARLAQARLAIARDTLATEDDNLRIASWRVQAGLVSATDREQARAQRDQTAATIPTIETNFRSAVNRLAVLTGRAPGAVDAALAAAAPIPAGPAAIAVGVPADTLRQRPDVRSAERQLAAATARIGVAEAQLYPALTLTGSLDSAASHVGDLGSLITSTLFASLAQTIFDGGRLRSQVRSARASADEAFATYKSTVLTGLEDVENALQALNAARTRQASLADARNAAQAAAELARSQYQSGLTDFLTLLQSEQSLLSARDTLASAQADQASAIVQLYLALGGGWQSGSLATAGPAQ
ncbi:efflux transporter outer membrane subunit [Flavisphingomonas formosensis]|uniref:efflux transporter outer membrane subunit n=1 Tax=Flavisphingomonas formosensis TaxID=861534 RepID=UPI0012F9FB8B|nr:efflux transporter outer membrane subunit [Sphingomonas formosensis]